jgi:hypothetical protein
MNYLLSHVIEGKIIGTRRRGRRRKQLLDDLKEARIYWKSKDEFRMALFGELNLEEAMDVSQDRLLLEVEGVSNRPAEASLHT